MKLNVCGSCGVPKAPHEFYSSNKWQCKDCVKMRVKKRADTMRPELNAYMQSYHLKSKYGLTKEQYDKMLERQEGRCGICHRRPVGKHRLSVDHCHKTGRVRGLLCNPCNSGMGRFEDDPERLHAAARYLEDSLVE